MDAFVRFVEDSTKRDVADENSVQVMTIHKAKGLEFDMVFLPFLEGNRVDAVRQEPFLHREAEKNGEAEWVLGTPAKAICEATPMLREELWLRQARETYEVFCRLYVALTRARHETILITTGRGKTAKEIASGGVNLPRLLEVTLGDEEAPAGGVLAALDFAVVRSWQTGEGNWFVEEREVPATTVDKGEERKESVAKEIPRRAIWARQRPSEQKTTAGAGAVSWDGLFGRAVGSCVHALWEEVEWVGADNRSEVLEQIRKQAVALEGEWGAAVVDRAVVLVKECLEAESLREVFLKPERESGTLWREQSFSLWLDGVLVNGIFDRVILGERGARIYDFKTDAADRETLVRRHSEQMRLYRRALAMMMGWEESVIRVFLVHVGAKELVEIA